MTEKEVNKDNAEDICIKMEKKRRDAFPESIPEGKEFNEVTLNILGNDENDDWECTVRLYQDVTVFNLGGALGDINVNAKGLLPDGKPTVVIVARDPYSGHYTDGEGEIFPLRAGAGESRLTKISEINKVIEEMLPMQGGLDRLRQFRQLREDNGGTPLGIEAPQR